MRCQSWEAESDMSLYYVQKFLYELNRDEA